MTAQEFDRDRRQAQLDEQRAMEMLAGVFAAGIVIVAFVVAGLVWWL
jgi:hypothetical protein